MKTTRRGRMEVNADILRVAQGGALKTHIVYQGNLNFRIVKKYLARLMGSGLLRHDGRHYYATEKGIMFLTQFDSLIRSL